MNKSDDRPRRGGKAVIAFAVALLPALPLAAEEARPSPSPAREGFVLESEEGEGWLRVTGYAQLDGRLLGGPHVKGAETFLLRRVRPIVQGGFRGRVEFALVPDFAEGKAVLQDAWVEVRYAAAARLRLGKLKTPFGLERLQSASGLMFVERALPTALAPNRDLGVQLVGRANRVSWAAGVFNGVVDGGSGDADANDAKDVAGRIVVQPAAAGAAAGLSVGVAATWGRQQGALPAFKTGGQQPLAAYRPGVAADGARWRLSPQASYQQGRLRGLAELVVSRQDVRVGDGPRTRVARAAWQAALAWKARSNLEAAARVNGLRFGDTNFAGGFMDGATAPRRALAVAASINWSPERHVTHMATFERTTFHGGAATGDRRPENALLLRAQIAF